MTTPITTVYEGTAFDLTLQFETTPVAISYTVYDPETDSTITPDTSITPSGLTATVELLSSETQMTAPEKALNRRAVIITADFQLTPLRQVVEVVSFYIKPTT